MRGDGEFFTGSQVIAQSFTGIPNVAGLADGGYAVFTTGIFDPTVTDFSRFDRDGQLVASSAPGAGVALSGLVGGGYAVARGVAGVIGGTGGIDAGQSGSVQRFSANGAAVGSAIPFIPRPLPFRFSLHGSIVAGTADGGAIGVIGGEEAVAAAKDGGYAMTYFSDPFTPTHALRLRIMARQASPSTAGPVSGEAGASASFATAPGVTPEVVSTALPPPPAVTPPPASAPTVVTGRPGGGASFGGVSGCNSAVCATEVRGALAVTDALRASQNVAAGAQGGRIDDRDAAGAVAALARAQAGGGSAAANQLEGDAVMRDYGELERLMSDITSSFGNMTPAQVSQQAALLNTIISDFMERENVLQRLGLYRIDPNAMDLVGALQIMNPDERAAFGMAIHDNLARGQSAP